jgi:hypothetical protein
MSLPRTVADVIDQHVNLWPASVVEATLNLVRLGQEAMSANVQAR